MIREEYKRIEGYMLAQMADSAHDRHHVYRVLHAALDIARTEENVDLDILITACLLHDVGRKRQLEDQRLCHARIGGEMALDYLTRSGWSVPRARHVKACIDTHRYRRDNAPESIEAKILFDADKLDVTGAIGIARTLIYGGETAEPLYILENGEVVLDGGGAEISSFFQEYNYKLKNIYDVFHTERARRIALTRKKSAADFYDNLYSEVSQNLAQGVSILENILSK